MRPYKGKAKRKDKHKVKDTDSVPKKPKPKGLRIKKSTVTTFIVFLCIGAVVTMNVLKRSKSPSSSETRLSRSKGNPKASLKIIEYLDFQCPNCAKGWSILKSYLEKRSSQLHVEVKFFPHEQINSMESALYAECAAQQGQFWEYADLLFRTQGQWRKRIDARSSFRQFANQLQLDSEELEQCVGAPGTKRIVLHDKAQGESKFIRSTPTYFINGKMVVGPKSLQEFLHKHFN